MLHDHELIVPGISMDGFEKGNGFSEDAFYLLEHPGHYEVKVSVLNIAKSFLKYEADKEKLWRSIFSYVRSRRNMSKEKKKNKSLSSNTFYKKEILCVKILLDMNLEIIEVCLDCCLVEQSLHFSFNEANKILGKHYDTENADFSDTLLMHQSFAEKLKCRRFGKIFDFTSDKFLKAEGIVNEFMYLGAKGAFFYAIDNRFPLLLKKDNRCVSTTSESRKKNRFCFWTSPDRDVIHLFNLTQLYLHANSEADGALCSYERADSLVNLMNATQ